MEEVAPGKRSFWGGQSSGSALLAVVLQGGTLTWTTCSPFVGKTICPSICQPIHTSTRSPTHTLAIHHSYSSSNHLGNRVEGKPDVPHTQSQGSGLERWFSS